MVVVVVVVVVVVGAALGFGVSKRHFRVEGVPDVESFWALELRLRRTRADLRVSINMKDSPN